MEKSQKILSLYPVHVSALERAIWEEDRNEVLTSALDRYKRRKPLPTS
jgi:hypothetical protein